jgi:hypothetical protein
VPSKSLSAPFALTACKIDFADNTTADKIRRVRLHNFTNELVSRCPAKAVVSPLEFKIRIADARAEKPDQRKSFGP